ncbi:ABC transporter permease [Streptomyces massasporeus]|uniref:ABC transporter permease n=1 Tax=Streptomyces massasporeus TaxID=67324 RepID=UPI0037906E60
MKRESWRHSEGSRLLRDVWLVFLRELSHRSRQPLWLILELIHPIAYMFLIGPLVGAVLNSTPGNPHGDSWYLFAPALMVQVVIVGSTFVGVSFLAEYRSGVFERFRVTALSTVSLLIGKVLTVAVSVLIQSCLILILCYAAFGVRPGAGGVMLSLMMVGLLSVALASASYAFALHLRQEESLQTVLNTLLLPLFLLSGTLLPITKELAPQWLWLLSRLNPIAYVMDAGRAVFRGDFGLNGLMPGMVSLAAMTTASLWWGLRTFTRHES